MGLVSSEAEGLETPFSKEEVFAAPSDLGKDKAPGLDGFTMLFGFFVGMWWRLRLWFFLENFMRGADL